MREFTRHSLSTTLKEVGELSIFSQEKIDFLCETRRLCGIAGAEALGMTRMITPSLSIAGDRVAREVEVIDVARDGLLEFNERVQGPSSRFIELQNELLVRLLARLGVAPTDQERARILNERTNDMLESYRMLVETLGGQPPPAPPVPSPSERSGRLSLVREAWADDAASDEAAIRAVLRDYAAALTARNVDDIEKLQVRMTPEQHAAMTAYFANAAGLRVEFSSVEVLLSGKDALASYVREDWFTDARLNRPMHLKVQLSTRLEKTPDGWRLKLGE
jgi:ketosteroid isomerase-like protein